MTQRGTDRGSWPDLPYPAWRETCTTLHLWTQIVGKIRLSQTPWLNHSWQVPLYVTVNGGVKVGQRGVAKPGHFAAWA